MKENTNWLGFFMLGCVLFMAHVFIEYLVVSKILFSIGVI
jgi:hypothetical protein